MLVELRYDKYPGLLGTCLSGAGPSIMVLATQNFETIAQAIIMILSKAQDVRYDWQVLELDPDGATVLTQIKTSVTSKRTNQGMLDDNELMARRVDALPSEYVTIAHFKASTVDDPFSTKYETLQRSSKLCINW